MFFAILAETGAHLAVWAAVGGCVVIGDVMQMRAEKKRQREDHRTYMTQAVAERDKAQECHCRMMLSQTWDEVRRLRKGRTCSCTVVGVMAPEVDKLTEGERGAVISGRYAAVNRIRNYNRKEIKL